MTLNNELQQYYFHKPGIHKTIEFISCISFLSDCIHQFQVQQIQEPTLRNYKEQKGYPNQPDSIANNQKL